METSTPRPIALVYNEAAGGNHAGLVAQALDRQLVGRHEVIAVDFFEVLDDLTGMTSDMNPFAVAVLGGDGTHFSVLRELSESNRPDLPPVAMLGFGSVGVGMQGTSSQPRMFEVSRSQYVERRLQAMISGKASQRVVAPSLVEREGKASPSFMTTTSGPLVHSALLQTEIDRRNGKGRITRIARSLLTAAAALQRAEGESSVEIGNEKIHFFEALIAKPPFNRILGLRIGMAGDERDQMALLGAHARTDDRDAARKAVFMDVLRYALSGQNGKSEPFVGATIIPLLPQERVILHDSQGRHMIDAETLLPQVSLPYEAQPQRARPVTVFDFKSMKTL